MSHLFRTHAPALKKIAQIAAIEHPGSTVPASSFRLQGRQSPRRLPIRKIPCSHFFPIPDWAQIGHFCTAGSCFWDIRIVWRHVLSTGKLVSVQIFSQKQFFFFNWVVQCVFLVCYLEKSPYRTDSRWTRTWRTKWKDPLGNGRERERERIRTFGALSPALFRGGLPTDDGRLLPVCGEKLSRELFES